MKKIFNSLLLIVSIFCLVGCNSQKSGVSGVKKYMINDIEYEQSLVNKKVKNDEVTLINPPIKTYQIGEEITVNTTLYNPLQDSHKYAYYIADWGDGTWSYFGPKSAYSEKKAVASLTHKYRTKGLYDIQTAAIDLSNGKLYGWSEKVEVEIIDDNPSSFDSLITEFKPVSSSNEKDLQNAFDGNSSYWTCDHAQDSDASEWIGMLFKESYKLSEVQVKLPKEVAEFGSNIAIEYTTDFGKTWYSLPKYDYLYDYAIGKYAPLMRFPNPLGATIIFDMNGIVANGVRFSTKLFLSEERQFSVEEIRAYGNKDLLLYTSYDDTYNADINNMWTIFGTAESEPIVSGSIAGESTNQSPFRTGFAMIASTEWLEWNGLKINWLDNSLLKNTYLNQLLNVKYGPDGWSNVEGYIYATADSAQHLGYQNHYVYNSIFIIALRNYILQGNNTIVNSEAGVVNIMDSVNSSGQTMQDRLDKAMNYMLVALEGKSGVLTINDPDNDGTAKGNSSNYWDVHRSFGYKSSYENIFYYASVLAYADLKEYFGNKAEASEYRELAEKIKVEFNKLFWDSSKGRYITSVNVDGERLDYGMTFVNFMAIKYGLASENQAKLIYSWVDGKRIIEGDTSTGNDIYGEYIYSARSNTVDASEIKDKYGRFYWWDHNGALPCLPGTFGGYGHQMQNGGTIFYISYYDLMGRINNQLNSSEQRFNTILNEFHKDSLRRNRYLSFTQDNVTANGEYSEGVIGEFPESGLVPYTFIEGYLGLKTTAKGLVIEPKLPEKMKYAGIREYYFGNQKYSIQVSKLISTPVVKRTSDEIFVQLPANKIYTISIDGCLLEGK